jgi:branched-chain amino acid transport system substrate-binding protein
MEGSSKGWIWGIVILIVIVLGGWWLLATQGTPTATETGPIKIGVIGPFTGDAAVYGEPLRNTVDLAVGEINAAGGINNRQVEAIFEDGKCTGPTAASAAQKLINVDKVQAIIGGFCSGETLAVVPIAEAAKVLVFSPSASSPALTGVSPYFFRDYPSDATQGIVLANVANSKGWKTVAFLQEQTDYGVGLYKAFDTQFTSVGGKTTNDAFPTDTNDFRSLLTKIKGQKPDALFLDTQTPSAADRILKQLKDSGWKPQIFVSDVTMGDPATLTADAVLLEGAIGAEFVPDANDPKFKHMVDSYKAKYNVEMPYQGYMACAYDAVNILKDGIMAVGYNGEKLATWSRTIQNWMGASGSVSIEQSGDRTSGHKAEVVKGGKVQPLQ